MLDLNIKKPIRKAKLGNQVYEFHSYKYRSVSKDKIKAFFKKTFNIGDIKVNSSIKKDRGSKIKRYSIRLKKDNLNLYF